MHEFYHYVEPNSPVLRKTAEIVPVGEIIKPETQAVIDRMFQLAYPEQGDKSKPVLVGLAAPQIGISKRIILVDIGADGKGGTANLQAFVNPEIISESEETIEGYEGCRSTDRVCGIVERRTEVRIKAYDRDGNLMEQVVSGFPAVIFQHEIDHLDGIVFVDRVKRDEDLHWVEKEDFPQYRKDWKNWPHKITRQQWRQIQGS